MVHGGKDQALRLTGQAVGSRDDDIARGAAHDARRAEVGAVIRSAVEQRSHLRQAGKLGRLQRCSVATARQDDEHHHEDHRHQSQESDHQKCPPA